MVDVSVASGDEHLALDLKLILLSLFLLLDVFSLLLTIFVSLAVVFASTGRGAAHVRSLAFRFFIHT